MKSAVKILLQVGEGEAAVLDSQSRIANWLYNTLLERANIGPARTKPLARPFTPNGAYGT